MTCRDEVLAAVGALLTRNGGQPVALQEVVDEVARRGGRYAESTVRTHVASHMCSNAARPPQWPDLVRVERGLYVLATGRPVVSPTPDQDPDRAWPWEGAVQAVFARHLRDHAWQITGAADTATRERGVDLLAVKGVRRLGAEVKGWPSTGYADPRRAGVVKPTSPGSQAGHWFAQALLKAVMLLDTHPGHESLVVLPEHARYRDLAARTRTGRAAAGLHVVLVAEDGQMQCDGWSA